MIWNFYRTAEPVADLITSRLPATLELALISALCLTVALSLGFIPRLTERGAFWAYHDDIAHWGVFAHLFNWGVADLAFRC